MAEIDALVAGTAWKMFATDDGDPEVEAAKAAGPRAFAWWVLHNGLDKLDKCDIEDATFAFDSLSTSELLRLSDDERAALNGEVLDSILVDRLYRLYEADGCAAAEIDGVKCLVRHK